MFSASSGFSVNVSLVSFTKWDTCGVASFNSSIFPAIKETSSPTSSIVFRILLVDSFRPIPLPLVDVSHNR